MEAWAGRAGREGFVGLAAARTLREMLGLRAVGLEGPAGCSAASRPARLLAMAAEREDDEEEGAPS